MPLSAGVQLAADHQSAIPTSALPPGWVFWRVRVVAGTHTVSTATWQFWVGKSSAGNPVDGSSGAVLDVNGDGYADFVVGAPAADAGGAVHLYLGSATPSAAEWNAASSARRIDLTNPGTSKEFGVSVASVGDVNGDGYADFLVGTPNGFAPPGSVRLYLGSATPSAAEWNAASSARRIDLVNPDGATSVIGFAVGSAGDVNGDGYADFLIQSRSNVDFSSSVSLLYLGSAAPSEADWSDGSRNLRIKLSLNSYSVASAGDVNGDGYGEFVITSDPTGLFFGSAALRTLDWSRGSPGRFDLTGPATSLLSTGMDGAAAPAGDVNGDGYADFVVGAYKGGEPTGGPNPGAAYVCLGSAMPRPADWSGTTAAKRIDLSLPSGTNAFYGFSVAGVGDVNGDGYADVIADDTGSTLSSHVYLGSAMPSATAWNGTSTAARIDLVGPDSTTSSSASIAANVTGVGDVNGDGYADFLVGVSERNSSAFAGAARLYLGSAAPSATTWNGAVAARRIDLIGPGPDGANPEFGSAVARAEGRSGGEVRRRLR